MGKKTLNIDRKWPVQVQIIVLITETKLKQKLKKLRIKKKGKPRARNVHNKCPGDTDCWGPRSRDTGYFNW